MQNWALRLHLTSTKFFLLLCLHFYSTSSPEIFCPLSWLPLYQRAVESWNYPSLLLDTSISLSSALSSESTHLKLIPSVLFPVSILGQAGEKLVVCRRDWKKERKGTNGEHQLGGWPCSLKSQDESRCRVWSWKEAWMNCWHLVTTKAC